MSQEAALGFCHILLEPTTWMLLPEITTNNSFLASVHLFSLPIKYVEHNNQEDCLAKMT